VNDEPDDYDERIIEREAEAERYLEMRDILRKLREMVPLQNARVTENDVVRLEHVVNGYLRILIACRPLGAAVRSADQKQLERELEEVNERLEEATATLAARPRRAQAAAREAARARPSSGGDPGAPARRAPRPSSTSSGTCTARC